MENFLGFIQSLSLVIIVGSTITIGALIAPTVFGNLSREEAGVLMIEIFKKFDNWLKVSTLALLGSKLLELALIHSFSFHTTNVISEEEVISVLNTKLLTAFVLVLIISALSFYQCFKLSPSLNKAYENDSAEFSQLHQRSELVHKLNFFVGLILLYYLYLN
jgi:uncharacterized membrane protein